MSELAKNFLSAPCAQKVPRYSLSIAAAIRDCLDGSGWRGCFSFDEETGIFQFSLRLRRDIPSDIKSIRYTICVKPDSYTLYAAAPDAAGRAGPDKMMSMAEFICRANYGLNSGNFEFNLRDGTIRFKSFTDCSGMTPTQEIIRNSIQYAEVIFHRYAPGITGVLLGQTALEAIEECDGPQK